ncbi:uncharacterized protein LOC117288898 [Asterias rubens]|uniref:uncharacterized protein LOC117288898 n=1 Tax=Asterias rubens TaxID=7604 RepID=UPI001455566A|nr:uncharacterized protein LOC117288898 [Asterias rubens]
MENVFNTGASTTYRIGYPLHSSFLPPIKFHQVPAIQLREEPKLPPRKFPISPAGPTRQWEKGTWQVLLPDIKPFTDKPIVRAPPPQEFTSHLQIKAPKIQPKFRQKRPRTPEEQEPPLKGLNEPLPPVVPHCADGYPEEVEEGWVEELCRSYHWKTTSKEAAKEGCLEVSEIDPPNSTLEQKSDVIMSRPMRYDANERPWQRVVPLWDRLQSRPHVGKNVSSRQIGKTMLNADSQPPTKTANISLDEKIAMMGSEDKLSSMFVRKCPGYAGYVPRSPHNVAMETSRLLDLRTMTTMKSSYRPFATKEYTTKNFAHRGPLSRTVTLTYPYNPYNKVENRAKGIEQKW